MKQRFSGLWATFEYFDDMISAIKELKSEGFDHISTHAPCPIDEINQALGGRQSKVPYATLLGAFLGFAVIVLFIIKTALEWVLPVSSKPIVGIPTMGPVTFVFSVLVAVYFTIGAIGFFIFRDFRRNPFPQSKHYEEYDRFMRDRFGIVVPCFGNEIEKAAAILKKHGAEEVNLEA